MSTTTLLALLVLLIAIASLFFWLRNRGGQNGAVAEPVTDRHTAACGESDPVAIPTGNVRAVFRVARDCGAGVVVEQRFGNDWQGLLPHRSSDPQPNERGFQGTSVFYGELTGEFRVRCLPGSGEGCEVESVITEVPRGTITGILDETVRSPCGKTAFIAKFNGLRRDTYEAELTVQSDCGAGVKVERFNHEQREVRLNNGAPTNPGGPHFEVRANNSAKWNVKSDQANGNVWFHITCQPGNQGTECKFKIVVRDPTI